MMDEGKYVFCITEGGSLPEVGEGIYTIAYRELVAVVRDCPLASRQATRDELVNHLRILEELMKSKTVIPVRFGTVASQEEVQDDLLAARYDSLREMLAFLNGKMEMGLKVLWRSMGDVLAEIAKERHDIRIMRDQIAIRPESQTRNERIELGRRVAEAIESKRMQEGSVIIEEMQPLVVDTRTAGVMGDKMVLNAAFLIERSREKEFDERVSALAEHRRERLVFRYIGPSPAVNFVNL